MQISSAYSSGSSMALQALRDLFQTQESTTTGQSVPSETSSTDSSSRASSLIPSSMSGGGFDPETFSAMMPFQSGGLGQDLVDQTDTDGSGDVSIEELAASLGVETSTLTESFASVDADGDGAITGEEMEAGFEALAEEMGLPTRPSTEEWTSQVSDDMTSQLLSALDSDGDQELSLSEILESSSTEGEDDASVSDRFSELDTDGDGSLTSSELSAALEAMISRQLEAYADRSGDGSGQTSINA